MFDKFGEFNSAEELNKAADGLLNEGDMKGLKELAKENGIDPDNVQDYIDGCTEDLATLSEAAFGRLYMEEQEAKTKKGEEAVAEVLFTMARSLCLKESYCRMIMQKGKRLMKIYELMKSEARKHQSGGVGIACGTDRELKNIIIQYYSGGEKEAVKYIEQLRKGGPS